MSVMKIMRFALVAILVSSVSSTAFAANNCIAVGGGTVTSGLSAAGYPREIHVGHADLRISKPGEKGFFTLNCQSLAHGVICGGPVSGGMLTVMTNGDRAVESVKGSDGREVLGVSYQCTAGSLRQR